MPQHLPLFPTLPIPCAVINNDAVVIMASPRFLELGYVVGKVFEEPWIDRCIASSRPDMTLEKYLNGTHWQILVKKGEGELILLYTDISKIIEDKLSQEEFSRTVLRHDAMTHITAISFFTEVQCPDWEEKTAKAITDLVELLEHSSLLIGASRTIAQPVVLSELVALSMERLSPSVPENMEVIIEGNGQYVIGDKARLAQVTLNLLGNAIKFQPKYDGHNPVVKATIASEDIYDVPHVTMTVEDNGIGIPEEFIERVFEPRYRLHSTDQYSGSGLGLAIARQVVQQHSGDISVSSVEGEGTKIIVRIPRDGKYTGH